MFSVGDIVILKYRQGQRHYGGNAGQELELKRSYSYCGQRCWITRGGLQERYYEADLVLKDDNGEWEFDV